MIILLVSLGVLACSYEFGFHKKSPLPRTEYLDEPVAILPVIQSNIVLHYSKGEKFYIYWVEEANEILNTLSSGEKSKLIGPKEVYKLIETGDVEYLNSILDQSGINEKSWQPESVGVINRKLGVAKIIRVKLEIYHFYEPMGEHGRAEVTTELFRLSPPSLIKTEYRTVHHYRRSEWSGVGGYGAACIFPTKVEIKDRHVAVDEALRQALPELLAISVREPTVQ